MKTDGFGITHRDHCKGPSWTVINTGTRTAQRCRACGVVWHRTDGQLPARPIAGYPTR